MSLITLVIFIIVILYLFHLRADIFAYFARVQYGGGKRTKALRMMRRADKLGPMSSGNRILYAYLALRLGNPDEAYRILNEVYIGARKVRKADKRNDQKQRAKAMLALVYWKNGELDTAIEMLEEVFEDFKNTNVYENLGLLLVLKAKDFPEFRQKALDFNLAAYEYNDTDNVIVDNLAEAYAVSGDLQKARETYEKLLERDPAFPEAYYGYGRILIALGEKEKGIEFLKKALGFDFSFLSILKRDEVEELVEKLEGE